MFLIYRSCLSAGTQGLQGWEPRHVHCWIPCTELSAQPGAVLGQRQSNERHSERELWFCPRVSGDRGGSWGQSGGFLLLIAFSFAPVLPSPPPSFYLLPLFPFSACSFSSAKRVVIYVRALKPSDFGSSPCSATNQL